MEQTVQNENPFDKSKENARKQRDLQFSDSKLCFHLEYRGTLPCLLRKNLETKKILGKESNLQTLSKERAKLMLMFALF